jgi:diaminopimelate epimerase
MDRCEQVGYLEAPTIPGVRARLRMMGGEFCGNASMAAAAWIADRDGAPDGRQEIALEVSGAEGPVACAVARAADGSWEGTVEMPLPLEIRECEILGIPLTAVFLPGMVHLIREGRLEPAEAERLLLEAGKRFREPAAGLIQWLEEQETLIPLVWVRESGTLVWETACGSGTEAAACVMSEREGRSLRTAAAQPGGILRAEVRRLRPAPVRVPMETAEETGTLALVRGLLLGAAFALILQGVANGGLNDVLVKAINICTECIGLG